MGTLHKVPCDQGEICQISNRFSTSIWYGSKDTHSKESIEWMSLLQHQRVNKGKPIVIQHARSPSGEKIIICQGLKRPIKYKVDGYFEFQGRKYVCEYHGCNFHGCKKCFPHSGETTMNNNSSKLKDGEIPK